MRGSMPCLSEFPYQLRPLVVIQIDGVADSPTVHREDAQLRIRIAIQVERLYPQLQALFRVFELAGRFPCFARLTP